MGYEPSSFATRRLRRYTDATRDVTLRMELLALLATTPDARVGEACRSSSSDVSSAPRAIGTTAMQTPPLAAVPTPFHAWSGERLAAEVPTSRPGVEFEPDYAARLPIDHLIAGMACSGIVRDLIASLTEQARAIALVREAHALGAAVVPPEVMAALATAAEALPSALRGAQPIV